MSHRPSQIILALVAVAAAGFLIGVAAATTVKPRVPGVEVASADIGTDGGTLRFDGGHLVFPAGALRREIHIVVRRFPVSDRLRISGKEPVIVEPGEVSAYSFWPANASFAEPVELTFRLPENSRNGSIFARRGDQIATMSGTVDPARATATTHLRDFRFGGV